MSLWRCRTEVTRPFLMKVTLASLLIHHNDVFSALSSFNAVKAAKGDDSALVGDSFVVDQSHYALELERSAAAASRKVRGSYPYLKLWRSWSDLAIKIIRCELAKSLPHPVDKEASLDLSFRLGVAADQGSMPCFGHPGGRAGYVLDNFCRVKVISDLVFEATEASVRTLANCSGTGGEDGQAFFAEALKSMGLPSSRPVSVDMHPSPLKLISLGGGPGYDFVAAVLAASFHSASKQKQQHHEDDGSNRIGVVRATPIHATVFDYESGWADLVSIMSNSVRSCLPQGGVHSCDFGKCDITASLSSPVNMKCREQVNKADVFICSYCVAENAKELRKKDYIFFKDLFWEMSEGSLFIFTETTHRLWPELVEVAQNTCDRLGNSGFHIAFPRAGRGKDNFQMVLQKSKDGAMSEDQRMLLNRFRHHALMHKQKIASGFHRQAKKIKGAK
uniref:Uncharacterized protein n=1 Tax=Odontella aurita TaxID=265563 RepID=A0A7S4N5E0_9STRA|mmetsp:Transcript_47741/g.144352  ORF Transcript_47741/g.144352 Transcript_47741/m.144352 type:complete len:447 (+) Transcript_47741:77-1417(+)